MCSERNTMDHITPGPEQEVPSDRVTRARAEFDRELDYATKSKTHLWTIHTTHVVSGEHLAEIHAGTAQAHLGVESLRDVVYGCFVCEEPFAPSMVTRKCRGRGRR